MSRLDQLFDLQIPNSLRISPNTQQILYATSLSYGHKTAEHPKSTIWLGETGKAGSARQLTSGLHNDKDPQWLPDGKSIAFISDRAKAGEKWAIYALPLEGGGEAYPITDSENERAIGKYPVSPDGKTIAFLSADEKTEARKKREKDKDDAQVWGEDWEFERLRLVHIATKTVTTLVSHDAHVADLAWNDEGTHLAYTEVQNPTVEEAFKTGSTISIIDVRSKETTWLANRNLWSGGLLWAGPDVYFLAPVTADSVCSSSAVFRIAAALQYEGKEPDKKEVLYENYAHGIEDCSFYLRKAGGDVLVVVQRGMEDQIRILKGHTLYAKKRAVKAFDAAFTKDSDEIILAIAEGDTNHPIEVYTTTASGGAMVKLSDHGHAFAGKKLGTCTFLTHPSTDSKVTLESPFFIPESAALSSSGPPEHPLPTVVLIHGGPYARTTESFDPLYYNWAPYLLSNHYAVLSPDYRGSSARGETFAAYARNSGKYDYEDLVACVTHAIRSGYADPDRLVVAGWSQGGYLSYLSAVRNGTHAQGWTFRAAIPGAGVTDWDTMTLSSDVGATFEADLAGHRPWLAASKDATTGRLGSAIWEVGPAVRAGVEIPPMLMLHGEKDARVPIEQARGMRRALIDARVPFEYVVYPRERILLRKGGIWWIWRRGC
ncbi:putative acylamino-acid-releasing enzyme [Teratosphaeria destructans]|uniref:Dipeptidyl-peptidase V n=1 Tax=Teratosphaeria destructans TaxID=418781 RepID=A0A9W7STF1_9PEZI|nr:putative acylamino-acid-releasing enzyme [Teratosphaeria destructans]